jgi:hypothetical protein
MPADLRAPPPGPSICKQFLAGPGFEPDRRPHDQDPPTGLRTFLAGYSRTVQVPPLVLGLTVLLMLAALTWRVRRPGWRTGLDAALLTGTGLALLLVSDITSMLDPRYGLPSVTLMAVGGVLAVARLRATFQGPQASSTTTDTSELEAP